MSRPIYVKLEWEKSVIENPELLKKSKQSEINVFFRNQKTAEFLYSRSRDTFEQYL